MSGVVRELGSDPVSRAIAAKVLVRAALRALDRGDLDEFGRLYEEADEQLGLAIAAMPLEAPYA